MIDGLVIMVAAVAGWRGVLLGALIAARPGDAEVPGRLAVWRRNLPSEIPATSALLPGSLTA